MGRKPYRYKRSSSNGEQHHHHYYYNRGTSFLGKLFILRWILRIVASGAAMYFAYHQFQHMQHLPF